MFFEFFAFLLFCLEFTFNYSVKVVCNMHYTGKVLMRRRMTTCCGKLKTEVNLFYSLSAWMNVFFVFFFFVCNNCTIKIQFKCILKCNWVHCVSLEYSWYFEFSSWILIKSNRFKYALQMHACKDTRQALMQVTYAFTKCYWYLGLCCLFKP